MVDQRRDVAEEHAAVNRRREHLFDVRVAGVEDLPERLPGADALARAQELLQKRRAALAVRKDCGVLPPEEERREAAFLSRAEAALAPARTDAEASAALQKLAADAAASAQTSREAACRACENGLRFVQNTFGEDQELWILLHGLQHTRAAEALQKDPATLCARLLTQATPAAQAATLRTELQRQ